MISTFRISFVLACCLGCFTSVAACSPSGGTEPVDLPTSGADAQVTAPADAAAQSFGVMTWSIALSQSDADLPGALDMSDTPADEGRVVLDVIGRGASGQPVIAARWAIGSARLLDLPDVPAFSDVTAVFAGSFVANANADGSAGAAVDDASAATLLTSIASAVAGIDPNAVTTSSLSGELRLDDTPGSSFVCNPAQSKAAVSDLGKVLKGMLAGADQRCARVVLGKPDNAMLSDARKGLFGVNATKLFPLATLQAGRFTHERGSYYPGFWCPKPDPNTPPKYSVDALAAATTVKDAQAALACVFTNVDKMLNTYKGASPAIGVTMTIPNLDGYQAYASGAQPWATYSKAYQNFACAAIADRLQNDKSGTSHVYELWNEPDPKAIAPLSADLLVPMVLSVIQTVRNPNSGCYDKTAKFQIGTAGTDYYASMLAEPLGPTLFQALDYYNLHPYNSWPDDTQAEGNKIDPSEFPLETAHGYSLAATLNALGTKVISIGGQKPIVFTEWGYNHGAGTSSTLSPAQCEGESKEISQFFSFFANPPLDVAPLAASVESADLYGWPRPECSAMDSAAVVAAAMTESTDTVLRACAEGSVKGLIASLEKTQSFADYLCCKNSLNLPSTNLAVKPNGVGACTCFAKSTATPFKDGNKCSACPSGAGIDTIAGCPSVQPPPPANSCVGRADGWYCDQQASFEYASYECAGGNTELGGQCATGFKCASFADDSAILDPTTDAPACQ